MGSSRLLWTLKEERGGKLLGRIGSDRARGPEGF